jgi:hypothetical protein
VPYPLSDISSGVSGLKADTSSCRWSGVVGTGCGSRDGGGGKGIKGDDCRAMSTSFGFVLLATTNRYGS